MLLIPPGRIEYFTNGKNAANFTPSIQDLDNLLVPSICIYEVFKRIFQELGEENAFQAVGVMCSGREVDFGRNIAVDGAKISIDLKLAPADSIILATARAHNAILWTQDAHFNGIGGVRYIEKKP